VGAEQLDRWDIGLGIFWTFSVNPKVLACTRRWGGPGGQTARKLDGATHKVCAAAAVFAQSKTASACRTEASSDQSVRGRHSPQTVTFRQHRRTRVEWESYVPLFAIRAGRCGAGSNLPSQEPELTGFLARHWSRILSSDDTMRRLKIGIYRDSRQRFDRRQNGYGEDTPLGN
jgi:hypothetical protein